MKAPNLSTAVAGVVALAAFVSSASHIYEVAISSGNGELVALIHPIGIDGLIMAGLLNLKKHPAPAWFATGFGVILSLAFNLASYGVGGMKPTELLLAVAMPVAMLLAFVVVHAGHGKPEDVPADVPPAPVKRASRVPAVSHTNVPAPMGHVPPALSHVPPMSLPDVPADVPTDVPVAKGGDTVPVAPSGRGTWDRDLAVKLLSEDNLSQQEIADRVGVSRKTIGRLVASLPSA